MSKTTKNLCLVMCLLALVTWTFAISGCGDNGSSDSGSAWYGDSGGYTSPTPTTSPTVSPTTPQPGTPTVTSVTSPIVPNGNCTITVPVLVPRKRRMATTVQLCSSQQ